LASFDSLQRKVASWRGRPFVFLYKGQPREGLATPFGLMADSGNAEMIFLKGDSQQSGRGRKEEVSWPS